LLAVIFFSPSFFAPRGGDEGKGVPAPAPAPAPARPEKERNWRDERLNGHREGETCVFVSAQKFDKISPKQSVQTNQAGRGGAGRGGSGRGGVKGVIVSDMGILTPQ
jgi:hypothetical protein